MNLEIITEAAQFPEKEHINGIFLAVHGTIATLALAVLRSNHSARSIQSTNF